MHQTAMSLRTVPDSPGALERLFREHSTMVLQAAYRVTGNPVDAEDVLQTVFLRLIGREQGYDLSPNPRAFFHRAAINAGLDIVRSRSAARSISLEEVVTHPTEPEHASPESQHAGREMRLLIQKAVARLGRTAAEIFVLKYFEGYENEEIAEALGMSRMVVAVLLHRAKSRVKKELGTYLENRHETHKA